MEVRQVGNGKFYVSRKVVTSKGCDVIHRRNWFIVKNEKALEIGVLTFPSQFFVGKKIRLQVEIIDDD